MSATGTIVYDADCGFCTWCADWVRARSDAKARPWQDLDLDALGLTVDDVTTAAYWLGPDGRVAHRGAGAAAAALRSCRRIYWRVLGRVVGARLLRPVAARVYALVAANRHRLPGGTAACKLG
ncbi:DCC1-like thiol-disulfide oxidoreductase family protein [Nocardioides sp. C4-1]|uniref:thiol-disulfide oxidoreductase DCC family protein n=1 Tax=Nocardioides sp. C4-1 TaxID=3151851 RepID=UPI0032651235